MSKVNQTNVLIIGAGAAGLAAARTLREAGMSATILEARQRIGGRIWTDTKMAKHPVELGAEFVHGSSVITWKYLKKYKLKTIPPIKDKNIYAALDGKIDRFDDLVPDDWEDDIWEHAEEWVETQKSDINLRQLLDEKQSLQPHDAELSRLINNYYAQEFAADLDNLGTYGLLEANYQDDNTEDGDFRIKHGYSALVEQLAKHLNHQKSFS